MRSAVILLCCAALLAAANPQFSGLDGIGRDPFHEPSRVRVLLFVRTDCPITNRYAPELQRIAKEYSTSSVRFWLVYADPSETVEGARKQVEEYRLPGTVVFDPRHSLAIRARATVAPEAAVFDDSGHLRYHGRIDNRWVSPGRSRPTAIVRDLEEAIGATLAGKPIKEAETRAVGCALADVQ